MCGFVFYSGKDLPKEKFEQALDKISHRGPDDTEVVQVNNMWMGFKRLAIMDLSHDGDQPFSHSGTSIVCNGEIYNYQALEKTFMNYSYKSKSDCEVLVPIFRDEGIEGIVKRVDAEYACVVYDEKTDSLFAARDPIGIRPLFFGYSESGNIAFASEVKALQGIVKDIKPFPPGHYYKDGKFVEYIDLGHVEKFHSDSHDEIYKNIKDKLV